MKKAALLILVTFALFSCEKLVDNEHKGVVKYKVECDKPGMVVTYLNQDEIQKTNVINGTSFNYNFVSRDGNKVHLEVETEATDNQLKMEIGWMGSTWKEFSKSGDRLTGKLNGELPF